MMRQPSWKDLIKILREQCICDVRSILEKNIETKLSSLGINGQIKATFIWDIFGRKIEGGHEKGLSDASDAAEFSVMLDNLLDKWTNIHQNGNEFHSWFKDVNSNAFVESIICSVQQRAGLGCPQKSSRRIVQKEPMVFFKT